MIEIGTSRDSDKCVPIHVRLTCAWIRKAMQVRAEVARPASRAADGSGEATMLLVHLCGSARLSERIEVVARAGTQVRTYVIATLNTKTGTHEHTTSPSKNAPTQQLSLQHHQSLNLHPVIIPYT